VDWVIYELMRREAAPLLGIRDESNARELLARAGAAVEAKDWSSAAEKLFSACQSASSASGHWQQGAAALLMTGDADGYRRLCQDMIERFAMSESLNDHERTIKTCLLQPGAVDLGQLPTTTVFNALDDGKVAAGLVPWATAARAMFALRGGEWAKAIELAGRASEGNVAQQLRALCLLVTAIARHRQGDDKFAKQQLALATQLIDAAAPGLTAGTLEYPRAVKIPAWGDWVNCEILRREAAKLLGATLTQKQAGDSDP